MALERSANPETQPERPEPPADRQAEALGRLRAYPLLEALANRRSRRFSRGAVMPGGGLEFRSRHPPLPLTKTEEALLCFAAAGMTGLCLGDVPFASGGQKESGGGNVMAALTGRTGASADAVHSAALFVINDEGTYLWKRPQDFSLEQVVELSRLGAAGRYDEVYDRMRVRIRAGRASIPREVPFMFPFNKWSTNLPGSTYFLPVCDLSSMYINVVLSGFDEQMALFLVDERNNFQPAGVAKFGRSRGGKLHDDPRDNRILPILGVETVIVEFMMAEQSFMAHNLSLMEQALGLGGWTHFATATETGWLEALGFRTGRQTAAQVLNAGPFKRWLMNLLGRNPTFPHALGLTVDGVDLLTPFCPPYYPTMEAAVLAYLDFKRANAWQPPLKPDYAASWKNPRSVSSLIPRFSDACVQATIAYCTYVYETYGRFPAYFGPMRTTLGHQAHHLDLEFYDTHYQPGAYTQTQAEHLNHWH
jgi:hypothetical protein